MKQNYNTIKTRIRLCKAFFTAVPFSSSLMLLCYIISCTYPILFPTISYIFCYDISRQKYF